MDYLVRLAQVHEDFRKAELQALADLSGTEMDFRDYSQYVRHYLVRASSQAYLGGMPQILAS